MNKSWLLLILFCSLVLPVSAVQINEIMYNPGGDDNNREFVEIYFDEWTNLTGWIVADSNSNDTLAMLQSFNSSYALVVEDGFNYSGINASVYSAGATIGNNLNNDNDSISLYSSNLSLVDTVSYTSSQGANGDNNSLQLVNGTWLACASTPGLQNNCSAPENQTGENVTELSIIYKPDDAMFGGNYELFVGFNSTNYDYGTMKLLVYGSHERVVSDSGGNKITSYASCQGADTTNVTEGQSYFFTLPFFVYPNCDNDYPEGTYEVALRACRPSGSDYTKYLEEFFSLSIVGRNSSLCPVKESPAGGSSSSSTDVPDVMVVASEGSDFQIKIIDYPKTVETGETFDMTVELRSYLGSTESFDVYSYIYQGRTLLTLGGWTGNRQTVELARGAKNITLTNAVKPDASLGNYTLKARTSLEDKKADSKVNIEIIQGETFSGGGEGGEERVERSGTNITKTSPVTGAAVWVNERADSLVLVLLLFSFVLLIFVVALIGRN